MLKLILFNLFCLLISHCYAMPQSDQFTLIANSHQLQFRQPNLGIPNHQPNHNQFNHQINHHFSSSPQLHSRPNQQDILRASRLLASASSPKLSIINTRSLSQENTRSQFNQGNQNGFKPINRSRQSNSNKNQKRLKQNQQKNHAHHHQLQSKINWGKCLVLAPSIEEKMKKAQVITKCLETTPVPENITRETIELHRELVAACCLKKEGWFTSFTSASLSSDDNAATRINVNNSKIVLNLTTSIDSKLIETIHLNGTTSKDNSKKNDSSNDHDLKDISIASESALKSIQLNDTTTKLDEKSNKTAVNLTKNDKFDNQTNLNESKHSALESDDYNEDDINGYSEIFTGQLTYNYKKAEHEIKNKRFDKEIEEKVLAFHELCKEEAQDKYNNPIQIIGQIQLYQSCMDYYISSVCGIEVQY